MNDMTMSAVAPPDEETPRRRILVSLFSWYYFRQLAPVIEILARQGHQIHIVALLDDRDDFRQGLVELADRVPGITFELGPVRQQNWQKQATALRQILSYVRYLEPRFRFQPYYRTNAQEVMGDRLPRILEAWPLRGARGRTVVRGVAERFERAIPPAAEIEALFDRVRPDVLVVTPLIDVDGEQSDYQKSAQSRGIPVVYPVHSWDNLSRKARIWDLPDRLLVWNETQVEEAVTFHGVPRDLIMVTGAQGFDEWFDSRPSQSREEFCGLAGLDPGKPFVLYLCSAILPRHVSGGAGAEGTEVPFVKTWLSRLHMSADPTLAGVGVLIRPHPKRHTLFNDAGLEERNVSVFPRNGELPNSTASKALFFDSLYHCSAVVGLNTSAMIEAGIVGRPVFTVLDPDYDTGQKRMQHFQHLLNVGGGLLTVAESIEEHLAQLADALRDPARWLVKVRSFTEAFVRPLGLDRPAAPIVAQAVLDAAAADPRGTRPAGLDAVLRGMLKLVPIEPYAVREARKRAERELARDDRKTARALAKRQVMEEKRAAKALERLEQKRLLEEKRRARRADRRKQKGVSGGWPILPRKALQARRWGRNIMRRAGAVPAVFADSRLSAAFRQRQAPVARFAAIRSTRAALRLLGDSERIKLGREQAKAAICAVESAEARRLHDLVAPLVEEAARALDAAEKRKFLQNLAKSVIETGVETLGSRNGGRMLVSAAKAGLNRLEAGEGAYLASAALSDLVGVHPRQMDPRSLVVTDDPERPVVVGPWLMEIGFEVLYWIPFLRFELARLKVKRERIVVVSRGGAEPWYRDIADRYVDVLDVLTPEQFHAVTSGAVEEMEGNRKPFQYGEFEADLLRRVVAKAGIGAHDVIMPSAMYGLFRNAWRSRFGALQLVDHLCPAPLPAPPPLDRSLLPFDGDYVAAKFYFSKTFPWSSEAETFCRRLIRALAERSHVVLLSNSARLDDHDTVGFAGPTRHVVFDANGLYGARDNLAVQTVLVANAKALHGTYGGFSYLGPLLGVDTFAYTGNYDFTGTHLDLAFQTIDRLKVARLALLPATPAVIDFIAAGRSGAGTEVNHAPAV